MTGLHSITAWLRTATGSVRKDLGFWGGVLFFIVVLMGLLITARQLSLFLMDANQMPLERLGLAGERRYTQEQEVQAALQPLAKNESFFSLDVDRVQQLVEGIPWIRRVSVRREWPNGLRLFVSEHQPVALWNDDALVNRQGEVFVADKQRLTDSLPHFIGPAGSHQAVLAAYRELAPQLAEQGFGLAQLQLSERHAWQAVLVNGIRLVVGRADAVTRSKRIGHFIRLYPMLLEQQKELDYVDLRYDTGFAVNWKNSQELRH